MPEQWEITGRNDTGEPTCYRLTRGAYVAIAYWHSLEYSWAFVAEEKCNKVEGGPTRPYRQAARGTAANPEIAKAAAKAAMEALIEETTQ